jgi:Zn-dependent protease
LSANPLSTTETPPRCRNCVQPLTPGAIVCPRCDSLVHEDALERIASNAKDLEAKSEWRNARDAWLSALPLLPADSQQSSWIRTRAQQLLNKALEAEAPQKQSKWAKRLGPLAPLAALLAKAKTLLLVVFKLKFLLSLAAFIALYWAIWGPKFGVGFAVLILIHEMGHFIDVKRRGLPAEMPVFLPGLGAYVKWRALGVSTSTRAAVSLAGPLAGWIASLICLAIWWKTGDSFWAGLARVSAWLNVFNLVPIWILDGGSAVTALNRFERAILLAAGVALWLILGEWVFLLVAGGAAFRLFTKDAPEKSDPMIAAYYVALVVCLGLVLYVVPGQIFPTSR